MLHPFLIHLLVHLNLPLDFPRHLINVMVVYRVEDEGLLDRHFMLGGHVT